MKRKKDLTLLFSLLREREGFFIGSTDVCRSWEKRKGDNDWKGKDLTLLFSPEGEKRFFHRINRCMLILGGKGNKKSRFQDETASANLYYL